MEDCYICCNCSTCCYIAIPSALCYTLFSWTLPQGFHQTTKIKFPDIPGRFLKIPDGASSVYHFSGRLHLPYTDHLPSPFNASISSFRHIQYLQLLYLNKWQFFTLSLRLLSATNANHQCFISKSKIHSLTNSNSQNSIPWHSLIFQKVRTLSPVPVVQVHIQTSLSRVYWHPQGSEHCIKSVHSCRSSSGRSCGSTYISDRHSFSHCHNGSLPHPHTDHLNITTTNNTATIHTINITACT